MVFQFRSWAKSTCLVLFWCFVHITSVHGQTSFFDDFSDGDADAPVKWTPRPRAGATFDASSGDYVWTTGAEFVPGQPALASNAAEFVFEDMSVVTQLEMRGPSDNIGVSTRWNEDQLSGYFAGISSNQSLFVGRCDPDGCTTLGSTSIRPLIIVGNDLMLRFDAVGNKLSAWAWRPGEEMPASPNVSVEDDTYSSGTVDLFLNARQGGSGTFRFVSATVPEPSTIVLSCLGFLPLLACRRKISVTSC